MGKGARHNAVYPALEVAGDVLDGFAVTETLGGVIEIEGEPSHACHAHLEGGPGAQRWLLKDHGQLLPLQGVCVDTGRSFYVRREFKDQVQVLPGQLALRDQVLDAEPFLSSAYRGFRRSSQCKFHVS